MFLVYFNTFLIIILLFGIIGIYILTFVFNIDFLINNNKIYILSYNATNINNINNLNLYDYSDIIFLTNFNINNNLLVTQANNLQDIPIFNVNNIISNQYNFYSASSNNVNILLGLRKTLNINRNPFLLFRNTSLAIVFNNNETFHCYISSNQNSDVLDIVSHIEFMKSRYNKYVIIGEIPVNNNISINNILNNFAIITNVRLIDKYNSIISFLNINVGTLFVINP
ncbi:hypothetical protein AMV183 [Betaentomopoxvirus amoorei]|uniref:Uncharacterized protein AMV183/G2R n=1 Tax=Amsacta moorei entomopoxvirus TaxID=28321 RepID=V183_AMEPV|nr:hypothetical protein AMV183 [Amsacta moorei entomopoxvirus]P29818.1 RecName: Full=Uncharacterized protein AMV183/G2R [Amsacta moorei entomopoxvirus]AAA42380.1 G2R ORF [unidentified entomopoxvirus]AAG02889.1 AMV183 [Amsacta moorei entomopoxvirus]